MRGRPVPSCLGFTGVAAVTAAGAAPSPRAVRAHVTITASQTPAFPGDAPDPDVVRSGGTYYAFTTGTALGNHLQALVDTTGNPASGWRSYTGTSFGSTALPDHPVVGDDQHPDVARGLLLRRPLGHVLRRLVRVPTPADSGQQLPVGGHRPLVEPDRRCSPTPPPVRSSAGPGGVLDPSPFVDPTTGAAYLLWKSNDGSSIGAVPGLVGATGGQRDDLRRDADRPAHRRPGRAALGDHRRRSPDGVRQRDLFDLLFSVGNFESASYAQALTTCSGPLGPCSQPAAGPFLSSYGNVAGPGGGSLFTDAAGNWWLVYAGWSSSCTNYSCGGVRQLFVAPINLNTDLEVPCHRPSGTPDRLPAHRQLTAASSTSATSRSAARPVGSSSTNRWWAWPPPPTAAATGRWPRRRHLLLRRRPTSTARPATSISTNPSWAWPRPPAARGYWLVASDGGIFSFGDAGFYGSTGQHPSQPAHRGHGRRPRAATGYWLVAADGGIFSFGDADFYGSTGGTSISTSPSWAWPRPPTARGYWLVAADGGIFSFGDAHFYGSTGEHPSQPAHRGHGRRPRAAGGYWLVAADGGIFAFGDAHFYGSTGSDPPQPPIVAMSGS